MKRLIVALFIAIVAISCTEKGDYKMARDEVMKFHDIVMADHSVIVNNQKKLDTLLKNLKGLKEKFPELDTIKEKETINTLVKDLANAEQSMNDWMYKFEPDVTGKSNEAAIQYFKDEKAKIVAVDILYKKEIDFSNTYLERFKK